MVAIFAICADLALADPLGHLDVDRVGGHLVVDQEDTLLLRRQFAGGLDPQTAVDIDGHRLGHVDVQARFDGGACMVGQEAGRHDDGYRLDAAFDHLLVAR